MNGYLLDTSVVSVFGPNAPVTPPQVADWFLQQERQQALFTSAIVVAELERGTRKLARMGATARAAELERWLGRLIMQFGQRILPVDTRVGRLAGELGDSTFSAGTNPGFADILIAATARVNDLTVLTCNERHFASLGVEFFDPLKTRPRL